MKKSKLIELLSSADEDEVYIDINGTLYDIDFGHEEAQFDGFDTLYEASVTLKPDGFDIMKLMYGD